MLRNFATFFKTWCWPFWYVWFGKMDMRKCNMNFKWLHKKWKYHTNIIQCLYLTWTWKNGSAWMNEKKQLHLLLAFTGKLLHYIYSSKSYPNKISLRHGHLINLKLNKVWKTSCDFSMIKIYDKNYLWAMLYHPEIKIYLDHITCLVIFLLRIFYYWFTSRIESEVKRNESHWYCKRLHFIWIK